MTPAQPSRTAMATSLMRAAHTKLDPLKLIDDSYADRWLADVRAVFAERMGTSEAEVYFRLREHVSYANAILRARFCEDALRAAVARGVRQYVIVGAGFDSFAQRRPDWARDVMVIEIDHPSTQEFKLSRIGPPPDGAHYVAADLGAERLGEALRRSPYRTDAPAVFAWLGVTMYLTREANFACFREIARVGARESELVFTYGHIARLGDAASPEQRALRAQVASVGEPFLCGFDPEALPAELADCGLTLRQDFGIDALVARYDPQSLNGMRGNAFGRVARTTI